MRVNYDDAIEYYKFRVSTIDWNEYSNWLDNTKTHRGYCRQMLRYSQKYNHLGFSFELVNYPNTRKKEDIIKAISNLCRYFDVKYDTIIREKWTQWLKHKGLSWHIKSRKNSFEIAKRIDQEKIFYNIKNIKHRSRLFAQFCLVTGLRRDEGIKAWNHHDELCDGTKMELFWKRDKKNANAVFCHPKLHEQINFGISESIVKRNLTKKTLGCELKVLRKINYTKVATKIDEPLAKFMQGRSGDISQRLYYLPVMDDNYSKWLEIWNEILKEETN